MFAVPLLASVISGVFAAIVLDQYRARRRPHQAAWGLALGMFSVAALLEAAGGAFGWVATTYKAYYLFGGLLDVAWLAVGTCYLLLPPRVGHIIAGAMAVISLLALMAVASAHTEPHLLVAAVPPRGALVGPVTAMALVLNLVGSAVLVGGAVISAWRALRRDGWSARVLGTGMIAAGALVTAAGHTYARAQGMEVVQPAAEALGVTAMFVGYRLVESWGLSPPPDRIRLYP